MKLSQKKLQLFHLTAQPPHKFSLNKKLKKILCQLHQNQYPQLQLRKVTTPPPTFCMFCSLFHILDTISISSPKKKNIIKYIWILKKSFTLLESHSHVKKIFSNPGKKKKISRTDREPKVCLTLTTKK